MNELYRINKTESLGLKGLAILIMIFHHVFGLYAVPESKDIINALSGDILFETFHTFAKYGKVCVMIFAYVTGYGYRIIISNEKRSVLSATWKRFKSFYPFFVFFVLVVYCVFALFPSRLNFTISRALLQCCGYSYLPDYWYITVVIASTLLYFPILLFAHRKGKVFHLISFLCLLSFNYLCDVTGCWGGSMRPISITLQHCVFTMAYFMLGYACCWMSSENRDDGVLGRFAGIFAMLSVFFFSWSKILAIILIVVLLFGKFVFCKMPKLNACLVVLGKFSACMWLNHRLIYGYWFCNFFYDLATPLNYVLIVGLSFILAMGTMFLWWNITALFARIGSRIVQRNAQSRADCMENGRQ